LTGVHRVVRWSRVASLARSVPGVRTVVKPLRRRRVERTLNRALPGLLSRTLQNQRLLLAYGAQDLEWNPRIHASLMRLIRSLPGRQQDHFEMRIFEGELGGFESTEVQALVMDMTVAWFSELFAVRSETEIAV